MIPLGQPMEEVERIVIEETLHMTDGDRRKTAEILGISYKTLYNKTKKYKSAGGGDDEEDEVADRRQTPQPVAFFAFLTSRCYRRGSIVRAPRTRAHDARARNSGVGVQVWAFRNGQKPRHRRVSRESEDDQQVHRQDYIVKASVGHVRDLPKSELGVDEETFEPTYEVLEGKEKVVSELRAAAKKAETSTSPPTLIAKEKRSAGTSMNLLGGDAKKVRRILFHEITKNAVRKAIEQPGEIDMNKVNAQQARRVLDRLVGYKLSPLLWDKVRRGLSAGRVQSVAMKMIVDREEEIKAFVPEEYWTFAAKLDAGRAAAVHRQAVEDRRQEGRTSATRSRRRVDRGGAQGGAATSSRRSRARSSKQTAAPPFITSTLQRTAYNRFKYPVKRTMQIAQKLYEGKELGATGHRRPDHLHAYRLRAHQRRRHHRSARIYRREIRRRYPAGEAERISVSRKLHRRRTPTRRSARRRSNYDPETIKDPSPARSTTSTS